MAASDSGGVEKMLPQFSIVAFGGDPSQAPTSGVVVSEVAAWEPSEDNEQTLVYLKNGKVIFAPVDSQNFGVTYRQVIERMADAYWSITH